MTNMESLYKEFKEYFDAGRERIDYFLEVMKNTREDKWEFQYDETKDKDHKIKSVIYDNIRICNHWMFIFNGCCKAYEEEYVQVQVSGVPIFHENDMSDELAIEILDFIERVEKRAKGE